jgi:glycosyltransferase involved in cell wall biosynthesis/tetratricopeptide (TPR) repeat protein
MTASVAGRELSLRQQGRAALDSGAVEEACAFFQQGADVAPGRPWSWLWLARARLKLGDRPASYAAIRRALEAQPLQVHSTWHLVHLLRGDGRPGECISLIRDLCQAHQSDADVLRRGAQTLLDLGAYESVKEVAGQLLALDGEDEVGVAAKATALAKLGEHDVAEAFIAARLESDGPASRRAAGSYYVGRGDSAKAWGILAPLRAEEAGAVLLHRVAQGLRRTGHLTAAQQAFLRAAEVHQDEAGERRWADTVAGEIAVLTGAWSAVPRKAGKITPVARRVLHLVGKAGSHVQSGYTLRTHYIAQSQQRAGLDPHVVTQLGFPWDQGVRQAALARDVDGVPYHHLLPVDGAVPHRPDDRLSVNIEHLASLVRLMSPAILHAASDFRNALLALSAGRAVGIPVVYEVRGFWEETWLSKQDLGSTDSEAYQWRRERELECMLGADAVVTLAEGMKDEIVARGVPDHRVTIVPNAVDVKQFVPTERNEVLAAALGLPREDVVLGYVSSFTAYEGIRYLIEAVAYLAGRGLPVRALLVGDGDEMGALRALAAELGIEDRVVFTGRVPHTAVLDHYGLIDIFVVPRTNDRVSHMVTPLKPYEAMATQRALIVSGVAALRGMVEEGVTAEVFQPEDAMDLADVAERLVRDPGRRRKLGENARSWVSENRTWTRNAEAYLSLYRSLGVEPCA